MPLLKLTEEIRVANLLAKFCRLEHGWAVYHRQRVIEGVPMPGIKSDATFASYATQKLGFLVTEPNVARIRKATIGLTPPPAPKAAPTSTPELTRPLFTDHMATLAHTLSDLQDQMTASINSLHELYSWATDPSIHGSRALMKSLSAPVNDNEQCPPGA